jgi:cytochrome b561
MQKRYSPLNQLIHWVTALFMFSILVLAWVMTNAKEGSWIQHTTYNWHKTLGLIVLSITLFRIFWRIVDRPPPYPSKVAAWDRRLAHLTYFLFFAVMIWMPVTGFLDSAYDGYPIKLFNLVMTPEIFTRDQAMADFWARLHNLGQWPVYALILLHLVAVVFHLVWSRNGVLGRMLPEHAAEPALDGALALPRDR